MSPETERPLVPRAPRFKVADSSQVEVTITRTEEHDNQPLQAELRDVSQHGAKLCVPVNLRFEEVLQLQIEIKDGDLGYQGVASVRHIRAVDDEHWVVGCAIAPPLSDKTFSYLATTAGTERRQSRRTNIAAEATVRRQAQTEGISAVLHNLSLGGLCFSSADQYEVGELIQFSMNGRDGKLRMIEARVCWQVESPEGSIAGCQFSSRQSYANIRECIAEQPGTKPVNEKTTEPTSKLVLTAAVLAMFVPPMMTLLLQTNKVSANGADTRATVELVAEPEEQPLAENPSEPDPTLSDQVAAEIATILAASSDAAASEEAVASSTATPPLREWVDNTGKHRTLAKLVSANDEHVVLLKSNGKHAKVPWQRLSEADRAFVRDCQLRAE